MTFRWFVALLFFIFYSLICSSEHHKRILSPYYIYFKEGEGEWILKKFLFDKRNSTRGYCCMGRDTQGQAAWTGGLETGYCLVGWGYRTKHLLDPWNFPLGCPCWVYDSQSTGYSYRVACSGGKSRGGIRNLTTIKLLYCDENLP